MRALLSAWLLTALLGTGAAAQTGKVIQLPEGEILLNLAWSSATELIAEVDIADGQLALRRIDTGDCSITVIPVPKRFAELKYILGNEKVLSGTGFATIIPSRKRSLSPAELRVFRIEGDALTEVNLRRQDREFYPELITWKHEGRALYVSAAPYVGAEQLASVVSINLASGAIEQVLVKSKVDLIEEIVPVPGRDALVLKCGSVNGTFPGEPVIALVDLNTGQVTVLHAEAQEFSLAALADGTVMLTAPRSARERWVLPPGGDKLQRIDLGLDLTDWTGSTDGNWLGGLAEGLRVKRGAGKRYAVLQSKDGRTVVSDQPSKALRFSPDGQSAAIVNAGGKSITIVDLTTPAASE